MEKAYYKEDDMLMLSGIQHFCFCPRQWYLIYVEQLWEENGLTMEGHWLHQKVHQPEITTKRKGSITLRSVPLASPSLGLYGFSDAVELTAASESDERVFLHPRYPGRWQATPIEYKRGRPKAHNADRLQLCAEAIALEELYDIYIPQGYLFYGETKHREIVLFDDILREETLKTAQKMHKLSMSEQPISATYQRQCKSCSLIDLCLPHLSSLSSASRYLAEHLKLWLPYLYHLLILDIMW